MEFLELRQAVSEAFWRKDFARVAELFESYLATAQGETYARGLTLQASCMLLDDARHCAKGFVLINEALPFVQRNPEALLDTLTVALGLAYRTSDVDRAHTYEDVACRLLLEHAQVPEVRVRRHRLQFNLGLVAYLRGDFTTAYWHFAQAVNGLDGSDVPLSERRGFEALLHVHVAMSCLRVRRFWESQEALDLAEKASHTAEQRVRTGTWRSELYRQIGRSQEAASVLEHLSGELSACDNPEVRCRYYLVSALVAQDEGNLPKYHQFLELARQEAVEHQHDYLLSEIQRCQRLPLA